ncbi:RepB family plasmid replication initiator protein [Lactococcus lactis subsp. lactis]|jgi:plasmid replication initiation protein|uniref:RepB family plasmid replication initiator protein n=1 Tax=Bacillota TaxID=1239 RepID=UPI0021B0423A|nr:RepB family plasmid replication initiator protein [Lactococcus lactis]MCT0016623.1 RepB family plasmid replication initiator protein [Lactococcus lactis subsp. lactis]MCT0036442.1 RepB family plasmid replication initiator protein [Lactococcus lactis subsp. lactis]MCT3139170.1 RepB family plasmid replication initiator protein [Lactococcus lactis]
MPIITEKQNNQKQVLTLNDLEKRKVVEHNSLITSIAKMDKTPLKMFELAVSCIDTENPPKDNTVYLSKTDLFAFFKVSDNDKHSRFKQAVEKMQKQAFFQIKEEAGKGFKFKSIVPIPYVEWTDYNDEVKIEFHREIMPYLINLKKNFTQHALSDIAELNSKYSIILYRWLSMNYNQYEHYSYKGGRRVEQVEAYRNPTISMEELRIMTDTVNEYKDFRNFEKRILKNSIEEITEHTSFNVTYDKIKKGRSIDSIVFHITKKRRADDNSYKLEDKTYKEVKVEKEQSEAILVKQAMESKYTRLLLENFLLSPYEMTDTSLMAGLQKNVYPKYDELKEARGLKGVETHLSYVASKQEGYSKRNVVKYLKTAIEGYLPTVALQDLEQPERANYKKPRSLEEVAKDFLPDYQNETSEAEKEELRRLKAEIDKKLRGEGLDHE